MHTYSILVDSASMGCQILWPFSSSLPTHCRNGGRSENLEGRVLMWGHNLPTLFEIVLTDLAYAPLPPSPPVPRSLLSVALPSQSENMVFLNADGHEIESLGLLPCSQWGRNIDKVAFKILYKYLHFYSIVLFIELASD